MRWLLLLLCWSLPAVAELTREEVREIGRTIVGLAKAQEAELALARRRIGRLSARLDQQGDALQLAQAATQRYRQQSEALQRLYDEGEERRVALEGDYAKQKAQLQEARADGRRLRVIIAGFVAGVVFLAVHSLVRRVGWVLPFWWRWLLPAGAALGVFGVLFFFL